MAKVQGKRSRIWIGGRDISGESNTVSPALQRKLGDTTAFLDSGIRSIPLLDNDTVDMRGYFEQGTGSITDSTATVQDNPLSATALTINTSDGTVFTVGDTIRIENERCYVLAVSTNALTVTRGYQATTAASHAQSTLIFLVSPGIWQLLNAMRAQTGQVASFVLGTMAQGVPALSGSGVLEDNFQIDSPVDGVTTVSASFKADNRLDSGIVLQTKRIISGASTTYTSNYEDTAASSNGAAACLHVFSFTAGTSVTCSVEHSTDNFVADITTLLTFAAASAAPTAQRVTASGTVKKYIRVKSITVGAGVHCEIAVALARL